MRWAPNPSDIVIPNFYIGFYEMDLCLIRKSGYVIEYEIKISRSDFKNDFNKSVSSYNPSEIKKHDEMAHKQGKCNKFYFVVPENLISKEEVPKHCGLIYYLPRRKMGPWLNGDFEIIVSAPLLHRNKYDAWHDLAYKLSFREKNLRYKLSLMKENMNDLKKGVPL
jgi:hypothetical protein